ncbi:sugar transferase [Porphyromonas pogonae]|uniref:sugar transferase n=1 Tax=Porphyromonas pogonae TaxID=867595 RepID=UPI002E7AACA1|nr:sugar transferase [Porphyromonas pogonae]
MFFKNIFDRVVSLFGLIILSPVLLIVALLIAIKMPGGPVIFKQKRVGQYGKLFTMVKFRSMTVSHQGSSISVAGEKRITPLGARLRKYKLDELPELWNVLKGEMSFVGPRPDVPGYADRLVGKDREVLKLKPGITGPASLKYRNEEEILACVPDPIKYNDEVIYPDKVKINLDYLHNWSFKNDILIILKTILG